MLPLAVDGGPLENPAPPNRLLSLVDAEEDALLPPGHEPFGLDLGKEKREKYIKLKKSCYDEKLHISIYTIAKILTPIERGRHSSSGH